MSKRRGALPLDIKPEWLSVIRRLQSLATSKNVTGCAIISMNLVIDEKANPLVWTEPKCTLIEPKRSNRELLRLLTDHL